jgi:hypothetical protein
VNAQVISDGKRPYFYVVYTVRLLGVDHELPLFAVELGLN